MNKQIKQVRSGASFIDHSLKQLQKDYPLLFSDELTKFYQKTDYADRANHVLSIYKNYISDKHWLSGIQHFAQVSYDFIYSQSQFIRQGHYTKNSENVLKNELYNSREKMLGYYLQGLFLTYALWPNHVKMYDYYLNEFITVCKEGDRVFELGVGHGLMAHTLLNAQKSIHYTGVDISEHALHFTGNLLKRALIPYSQYQLHQYNIFLDDPQKFATQTYLAGLCCEVLEHVEQPHKILEFFKRILVPRAPLFITTVTNLAAEDHIYLFETVDDIHLLLDQCGFDIQSERVFSLEKYSSPTRLCANYAAMITPRGV